MKRSGISGVAVLSLGLLLWASPADAVFLHSQTFAGNDCSGVFGQGFGNCAAFGSPIIIKFEVGEGLGITGTEINSGLFPSVDGSEFLFTPPLDGNLTSGAWDYTPGPGDPQIKYWAAKGGPNFTFFWVDNGENNPAAAIPVTSSVWFTPLGCGQGGQQPCGLSHLSFYDTGGGGGGGGEVPGPAALVMLGAGVVGMWIVGRRKRS